MSVIGQVVAERDALKTQLNDLRRELREIIIHAYGEEADELQDDAEMLLALENLCGIIEARDKHIDKLERALKAYQEMFPCSICGKPMNWEPYDNLGQALRAFVKEKRWGHGTCVSKQKR